MKRTVVRGFDSDVVFSTQEAAALFTKMTKIYFDKIGIRYDYNKIPDDMVYDFASEYVYKILCDRINEYDRFNRIVSFMLSTMHDDDTSDVDRDIKKMCGEISRMRKLLTVIYRKERANLPKDLLVAIEPLIMLQDSEMEGISEIISFRLVPCKTAYENEDFHIDGIKLLYDKSNDSYHTIKIIDWVRGLVYIDTLSSFVSYDMKNKNLYFLYNL